MTMPRKFESAVEAAIRQAQEQGRFDDLPGRGKPIPGAGEPDDDLWWVKGWVEREGLQTETMLPPSLRLRKEVETLRERVAALVSERAVRDLVEELNRQIRRELVLPTGPKAPPRPVDIDEVVATWAADCAERRAAAKPPEPAPVTPPRHRWFRRRTA